MEERAATWNVSSMVCRSGQVVKVYTEGRLTFDVIKRQGERAKMLGDIGRRHMFFWQGCNKGNASVGVFTSERWIDIVVDMIRVVVVSAHSLDPCLVLLVHQPAYLSIWSAAPSLQRSLSTNPGVTVWCVCGCS